MNIENLFISYNKNEYMKKIIIFVLAIALVLTALFFILPKKKSLEKRSVEAKEQSSYLEGYLKSDWINVLPDYEWEDIEKSNGDYSYTFKEEDYKGSKVNRSVEYKKTEEGTYQGVMGISFSAKTDSYIATIPKSFASHVDELTFSIEPSKIINPDPVVEFENIESDIEIESTETKEDKDVEKSLEEQVLETEHERCKKLEGEEAVACTLSLIARHRDSKELKKEISSTDMSDVSGASLVAVFNGNMRPCKYIKDRADRQLCYEYSYQTLVDECHKSDGKEYRDCVRKLSNTLPSFEEQRLFCGHIDDEQMRKECQGVAPVETCDEIENEELRGKCKLNIARTNGDIKICDEVKNSDYKQACIAIVGVTNEDESYCDKVKDDYLSGQCRVKIAMQKNDKEVCAKIKDGENKDLCYSYFLMDMKTIDQKMCSQFNELFLRELCELALAIKEKDAEKCMDQKFITLENRALCLGGAGMKHGDAELCGKIDPTLSSFTKEQIFEEGILPVEIEEERVLKEILRDNCYAAVAKKNKDKKICDKITDKKLREKCKDTQKKEDDDEDEKVEKEVANSAIPPLPDWMDCPIIENSKLHTDSNDFGSGYKYTDLTDSSKIVGPNIRYKKPDFAEPYLIFCYNADGEKHGPFKEYTKDNGLIRKEGQYKNGKYDQNIKQYDTKGAILWEMIYVDGVKNGPAKYYCAGDACGKGTVMAEGVHVDGKRQGVWQNYRKGSPTKSAVYDKGHAVSN